MAELPIQVGEVTITDYQTIVAFQKGDLRVDIPREEWTRLWRNLTTFKGEMGTNTTTIPDIWRFTALTIRVYYLGGPRMETGSLRLAMDIESLIQDESIQEINRQYGPD